MWNQGKVGSEEKSYNKIKTKYCLLCKIFLAADLDVSAWRKKIEPSLFWGTMSQKYIIVEFSLENDIYYLFF